MPKIEIELSEVEHLRDQAIAANNEKERLELELYQLKQDVDKDKLRVKAIKLSHHLFQSYISTVFKKLGFDVNDWYGCIRFDDYVSANDNWWERADLKVTLSAELYEKLRFAFLRIGAIPKEELTQKDPLEID